MTIAIPIWHGRISPLLDTSGKLLVLACRNGVEISRKEIPLEPQPTENLARQIARLGLDLLLCGAASKPLLQALKNERVEVHPRLCGEINQILEAFCKGHLGRKQYRIPGCRKARTPTDGRRPRIKTALTSP